LGKGFPVSFVFSLGIAVSATLFNNPNGVFLVFFDKFLVFLHGCARHPLPVGVLVRARAAHLLGEA
jgi:hypothetical protein